MKHAELHKEFLGNKHWFVEIELIPENDFETKAIQNIEKDQAGDDEREAVENYLHAALTGMFIVNLVRQKKNVFALTVKT